MKTQKTYWEMNTAELRKATKEFDEEFVILKSKPLSPEMRARWEKARRKNSSKPKPAAGLSVTVRSDLLSWLTAQARSESSAVPVSLRIYWKQPGRRPNPDRRMPFKPANLGCPNCY